MGRKNKKYHLDLHQQAYKKLVESQAFGESKRAAAPADRAGKIYSYSTYQTYWKHIKYYVKWVNEAHPECTTLKSARKYCPEWLQMRTDQGLSAWTIQTEAKALGKLYGINPGDKDYFKPPERRREDIQRSRTDTVRDTHFSKTNNAELIEFCRGTGLRRSELESLHGGDLVTREQIEAEIQRVQAAPGYDPASPDHRMKIMLDTRNYREENFIFVKGKGGRTRLSPIVGQHIDQIVDRMRSTPTDERVWQHVHSGADVHGYRSDYSNTIYREYARPIEEIPYDSVNRGTGKRYQSEVYVCRKDEAGRKLDRAAMQLSSTALGHNRIEVVATNYLRGL